MSIPGGNGSSVKSGRPGTGGSGAGSAVSKSDSTITTDLLSKPIAVPVAPSTERPWPIASSGLPDCAARPAANDRHGNRRARASIASPRYGFVLELLQPSAQPVAHLPDRRVLGREVGR